MFIISIASDENWKKYVIIYFSEIKFKIRYT